MASTEGRNQVSAAFCLKILFLENEYKYRSDISTKLHDEAFKHEEGLKIWPICILIIRQSRKQLAIVQVRKNEQTILYFTKSMQSNQGYRKYSNQASRTSVNPYHITTREDGTVIHSRLRNSSRIEQKT